MRPFFIFQAAASDDAPATLSIYDEIGYWGVQAKDFRDALEAVTAKVLNVEINSPGGDVFAGLAIYNMLKASGKEIVVKVMGVAASAASLIAMAGDRIIMPKNTMMMVHNPWSFAIGNADELRETADVLDKIGTGLLATYAAKTGLDEAEVGALLAKDTWMTADEALAKGFATEVVDAIEAKAKFDLDELPESVRALFKAAEPPQARKPNAPLAKVIREMAVTAGLEDHADFLAVSCVDRASAEARITECVDIRDICAFAQRPDDATEFVRKGTSLAEARIAILNAMAAADQHTSNVRSEKPTPKAAKELNSATDNFAKRRERNGKK